MNKKINANKAKFTISCYGVELPFEWYSMEYILKELENSKLYFRNVVKMEKSSASEEADNQAALFIECYLQRKFNLLDS